MTNEEIAVSKRNSGYNCAQAVACTYCEKYGIDEAQMFRISEALGTGMGCTLGNCGALSAACMIVGLKGSTANLQRPNSKGKTYPVAKAVVSAFQEEVGALTCREIKGLETGTVLKECEECVRIACRIIERVIG